MTFARLPAAVFRSLFVSLVLLCPALAAAAGLPAPVAHLLADAQIPATAVAVLVQPVDGGPPLVQTNVDQPMNPASVMKLVTAFAALERFGPAHTWQTRVALGGPVENGVLDGDLFLIGGGDPRLDAGRLWKLLRQVRALGVDKVAGDIVVDGSALALPPHDPAAFDGKALRPYNSVAFGLLVHANTLDLALVPAALPGEPVRIAANPPLHGLELDNRLATADGECGSWYRDLDAQIEAGPGGPRLALVGSVPASCGRRDWGVAPLPAERFAVAAVAGLWAEIGGGIEGSVRPGKAPADAPTLLVETSPPLAEAVREMNKWSSNVLARQLVATLGADDPAAVDMVARGAEAVRAELAAAGIDVTGLVIENGSGLSRVERVTARTLGELLLAAWRRPYMPEFVASLPIVGLDGTARRRLSESAARGYAHVKTGSINEVRAVAGYVLNRDGRRHVVAVLVNHPNAAASQAAQDALLEWVWNGAADAR